MKCPKCRSENPSDSRFCNKCATPLPQPTPIPPSLKTETVRPIRRDLSTGTVFANRYQIIEELGKGGMGRVYKVLDTEVKEKVALKLIRPEVAEDEATIERFRNELKLARKVRHKNVCQMFDLGNDGETYFITMEYVPGEDLKNMIRMSGQLGVGTAVAVARQVAEGLAEAHKLGVVHRDLKPSNIMVDRDGHVRIMDFGIARSLRSRGPTGAGVLVGTPEYMSPEQVDGKEADQRSDIYSFGVILYEMVTGHPPFEGDTPLSVAYKHKNEPPKDPRTLTPSLPAGLSAIILKCLEKDREKRYESAEALLADLGQAAEGIPTTELAIPKKKPLTSKEITVTFKFRLRKLLIPGLAIAGLIVAAIVGWRLLKKDLVPPVASGKPSLAVLYFKNNTGDESLDYCRAMLADALTTDLSQSKFLDVMSGEKLNQVLDDLRLTDAKAYSSRDIREIAARGGVGRVLTGDFAKTGEAIRINISLHDALAEKMLETASVSGKGLDNILPMVDDLTRNVKGWLRLSEAEISADMDKEVGKITTSSPEAYRYYTEGRKYHHSREFPKSIALMEKAVSIDPAFAMAYRSLAASYYNLGRWAESEKIREKALALSDRLSERERLIIEGDYYYWRDSDRFCDKAIESYKKLLTLYPEDNMGNFNLGVISNDLENFDQAVRYLEVCRRNRHEWGNAYSSLAIAYRALGLYGKAQEALEFCLTQVSDNAHAHGQLADLFLAQGKFDLAGREVDKAMTLDPTFYENFMAGGDVFVCQGELAKAEAEYGKLLQAREPVALYYAALKQSTIRSLQGKLEGGRTGMKPFVEAAEKFEVKFVVSEIHQGLAYGYFRAGKLGEALGECREAEEWATAADNIREQIKTLHLRGIVELENNSLPAAEKTAEELKALAEASLYKKETRRYQHLRGLIDLKQKDYSKAVKELEAAVASLPYGPLEKDALFLDGLAEAYFESRDMEKAEAEYKKITALTTGRLRYGDIYVRSFYWLGRIAEQKGLKDEARDNYRKFLNFWKDADPGLRVVEDAKKRLAVL